MKSLRHYVFAAILSGGVFVPFASAQTSISIVSGNGQVACTQCVVLPDIFFAPLIVQVTDGKGNGVPNIPVAWNVSSAAGSASFTANNAMSLTTATVNTDKNGFSEVFPAMPTVTVSYAPPTFFNQATITAAVTGLSPITFTITNSAAITSFYTPIVTVDYSNVPYGQTLDCTGGSATPGCQAGKTAPSFTVQLSAQGTMVNVPNVSLRLINVAPGTATDGTAGPSSSVPSAFCQTQAGADPYSVLTDSTGTATCTPQMGSVAGQGMVYALIGSVPPASTVGLTNTVINFAASGNIMLNVTPVAVGSVVAVSSATQTVNPSQSVTLTAKVEDSSGNGLQGQGVTWSVSPANAAVTLSTAGNSASGGTVTDNVTLGSSATGTITITVTSTSNPSKSATFTLNVQPTAPPITPAVITKVAGGDGQTAKQGAEFTNALAVTVTSSSSKDVPNVPVTFTISGPATFTVGSTTTTTVSTNSSGQASVNVTATATGSTSPATVTVTASVSTISTPVTFTLTALGLSPTLTKDSFVNAADQQVGSISPCSLAAIIAPGFSVTPAAPFLIGQNSLGGASVTFNGTIAPIQWAGVAGSEGEVIFQVPCEATAGNASVVVTVNGASAPAITVPLQPASPGIFKTIMSDGTARALIIRPDGSIVSLTNPARAGEYVTALATGLGPVSPSVPTNSLPIPPPGAVSVVTGQIIVGINNAGVTGTTTAQLSTDVVGVFLVTFQIPPNTAPSNNSIFSIGVAPAGSTTKYYSAGSLIPIQ